MKTKHLFTKARSLDGLAGPDTSARIVHWVLNCNGVLAFLKKFFKNKSSFNNDKKLLQEFRELVKRSGGKITKKMEEDLKEMSMLMKND